jgi:hypothetical protein
VESLLYPAVRAESQAPLEPPLGHGHDGGRHAEGSSWYVTGQMRCAPVTCTRQPSRRKKRWIKV